MNEQSHNRRLAAILAADVADYSRHMGADEDATMDQWWRHRREVIDPGVTEFRGRIVKHTGDGFLAEFASALDAVKCALALQTGITAGGADIAAEKRLSFRMGVNLGDIMSDDDDIYGDGVNIAARIEALADPGGVMISASVYEQIRSKPGLTCETRGEHELKNIAEPVRVYAVSSADAQSEASAALTMERKPAEDEKPSIAVLPFDNMSGDPEQEYFADGITEDLITDLSKLSGLLVIARNSVFTYKGKSFKVPDVCRELGVRWALEGSVRKAGNRVRITAQLIDGSTGGHLWAERYDRDLDDIFAVQDEVSAEIISALKLKITSDEQRRMAHRGTEDTAAYDKMLRARDMIVLGTEKGHMKAREVMRQALESDPNYATAMGGMAMTYIGQYANQWGEGHREAIKEAEFWSKRGCESDPDDLIAILARGVVYIWQNRFDDAQQAAEHLVKLNPNSMDGLRILANIENYRGNPQHAVDMLLQSMRLDPYYPDLNLHVMGQCYFAMGKYEEAADCFRRRIERNPDTDSSYVFLAGTYGHLGMIDEAKAQWAKVFEVKPDYSLAERTRLWPYEKPDVVNALYEGLKKAGIDPGPRP